MASAFDITAMLIRFTAIFIHSIGIYCLLTQKRANQKQRNILLHLSSIEILMTANLLILQYLRLYNISDNIIVHILAWDGGNDITFYLIMCFISLDRLLCAVLRLKYNYYVTTKRVNTILYSLWLFGFLFSIPFHFVDHNFTYTFFYHYCYQICDPICVVIAIISFSVIASKLRKSRITLTRFNQTIQTCQSIKTSIDINTQRTPWKRMYYVPGMIIITFVVFYFIPDLIITIEHDSEDIANITPFIWSIGLMTDPLIYIFVDKKIRMRAWKLLRCGCTYYDTN